MKDPGRALQRPSLQTCTGTSRFGTEASELLSGRNRSCIFEKLPLCPPAIELNSFLLVYINFRNSNLLMQGGFAFI